MSQRKKRKKSCFLKTDFNCRSASWKEGQPNNFGGSQECVYGLPESSLVGDVECSINLCPLCQLEVGAVFQFSGVCLSVALDVFYVLQV